MGPVIAGLVSGLIFGVGLVLGGMTQPGKVLGFLDFTGSWDPSLALVMGGAIAVYAPAYRFIVRARVPSYARAFVLPTQLKLDKPLIIGAGIFGIGWGLGGFCPGPGIVSAGTGQTSGVAFVVSMLVGMLIHEGYVRLRAATQKSAETMADAGHGGTSTSTHAGGGNAPAVGS